LRILYITRYFPPEISGGARRPSALIAALRRAGANVTLCAPKGVVDADLIEVAHPTFPALPLQPPEQNDKHDREPETGAAHFRRTIGKWLRRNLLLPDPEIRWALRVVKTIKASGRQFDWILTSSPPESLHVAGALLKEHLGAAWVCDVRDHWIETPQRLELKDNPLRASIERAIARACFERANALIGVSRFVLDEAVKYAKPNTPTLELGHFADMYDGPIEALPHENLNLVHTGSIRLSNPLSEFGPMLSDFEALSLQREDAVLWLAGDLDDDEMSLIAASPAASKIKLLGRVSMARARALQSGADILVLASGRTSTALPGKFSEYVQTRKPVVLSARGPWTTLLPSETNLISWAELVAFKKGDELRTPDPTSQSPADDAAQTLLGFLRAHAQ
jgi:glycosyltransferase involved in cell wall biosynthesis